MQKSKKMMVSLCGLALSSLFVLNNKSVVRADTVDGTQNNAISWNSDSDAAQNVQNTQKADDNQQNAAQSMQSRAETSNVESSTANRSTAVQNNAANARTVQDIKVANVDTAEPVIVKQSQANYSETLSNLGTNANLGDLGVYDVSPDGVKNNIQSQVQSQLAIDDASLANFNMNKDASGNLTASFGVYSNTAKQQNWWTNVKVNNTVVPGIQWRTNEGAASDGNLHLASTGQPIVYNVGIHKLPGVVINNPAGNKVNVHYVNSVGKDIADPAVKDTVVDTSKAGSGSYSVPNGYSLNDPDGKYTVSGGAINGTNLKGSVEHHVASVNYGLGKESLDELDPSLNKTLLAHANDLKAGNSWYLIMRGEWDKTFQDFCDNYYDHSYVINQLPTGNPSIESDDIDTEFYGNGSHDEQTLSKVMAKMRSFYNEQPNVAKFIPANRSYAAQLYEPLTLLSKTEAYDEQHLPVAFVDSNNNIVGMVQNYSGKVGTTQNVNLTLPTGYKLADGASLPTSVTFQNSTNPLLVKVVPSGKSQSVTNPANNTINVKFVDQTTGAQAGTDTIDLTKAQNGTNYYNVPKGYGAVNNSYQVGTTGYSWKETENLWTNTTGKTSGTFKADDDGLLYTYKMFGVDPNKELKVKYASSERDYVEANGKGYALEDYHDALPDNLQVTASQYQKLVDFWKSFGFKPMVGYPTYFTFTPSHGLTDAYNTISGNTVTVPVHKTNSFSFADNSGNVKSVSGNTVDVVLTKPQSVNPATDTRCQSQATRTIQINFPDGQVPKSYDGIVNKSGKLVQTVHFTRTATEDALTGNILQYGSWTSDNQDHNFIGFEARTLPRIPGYTLSIKPA